MKATLIGAALIAAALASPASAQHVVYDPGYCAQFYPNANCQNEGGGSPYGTSYQANNWNGTYARVRHHRQPAHHRNMRHRRR